MKRLTLILFAFKLVPAAAAVEFRPQNVFRLVPAWIAGKHELSRVQVSDPIIRSRRVPLQDVYPCAGDAPCVLLNGRRVDLEATPAELLHQKVQVVGRARGPAYTGVFARVRFGPWTADHPDNLLVWAVIRNRDHRVKIQGYSVDRDGRPGTEYDLGFTNYALVKYLTSPNVLETQIARELVERHVFCLKYPAEPVDTLRDEEMPLRQAGLLNAPEARTRWISLQAVASVIDIARGRSMCESPITDQVDGVLDQVREALETFVRQASTPKVAMPAMPRSSAPPVAEESSLVPTAPPASAVVPTPPPTALDVGLDRGKSKE